MAKKFHLERLHGFATARNEKAATELISLGIEALQLEVTSPKIAQVKRHISEDYLVNNAGRSHTLQALDVDISEVEATFETSVLVMRMCQAFAPLLIRTKSIIIQIGSVVAVIPYVFGSAYNVSKAALPTYSDTLRIELAPFRVKVMVVVAGGVKSNVLRLIESNQKVPYTSRSTRIVRGDSYIRRRML